MPVLSMAADGDLDLLTVTRVRQGRTIGSFERREEVGHG